MLFLGLREAKWGIWIVFMDYRLFHMDSMDLPSNQQTTIRDYLKPGSIVVFAIIVIIIHLIPPTPIKLLSLPIKNQF